MQHYVLHGTIKPPLDAVAAQYNLRLLTPCRGAWKSVSSRWNNTSRSANLSGLAAARSACSVGSERKLKRHGTGQHTFAR